MNPQHWRWKYFAALVTLILAILGIYSFPAIKTRTVTGASALPPTFAPDVSLYLNLSQLHAPDAAGIREPYYKATVPPVRLGYLKFRLAFVLFHHLNTIFGGNFAITLFAWNLLWWGLLCGIATWLLYRFPPDSSLEIVLCSLGFLMLFSFGLLKPQVLAWLHPLSVAGFQQLQLPYVRPFFPQIPVPLLLLYLGLQMEVLRKQNNLLWIAMGAVQLLAFMIFPYTILMMAGTTAIVALTQIVGNSDRFRWRTILLYGAGCGAVDLLFFLHGAAVWRAGSPEQNSLVHVQLSELPHLIGGTWLLIALLTALVILNRDFSPDVKWPLAGLGVSNLFFLVGDAFFAVTSLQMSHHAGYFVQMTAAVLAAFLAASAYKRFRVRLPAIRFVPALLLIVLLINGALLARATYASFFPANVEQSDFARLLKSYPPKSLDLVISRSQFSNDPATWAPLLTDAEILFCRNAQFLLLPEQNQGMNRFRQAIYLYFTGHDSQWLEQVLDNPRDAGDLMDLALAAQVAAFAGEERQKGAQVIRGEIGPPLAGVEAHDQKTRDFFSHYPKILLVDDIKNRKFDIKNVESYLNIEKEERFGELVVLTCTPRSNAEAAASRSGTK